MRFCARCDHGERWHGLTCTFPLGKKCTCIGFVPDAQMEPVTTGTHCEGCDAPLTGARKKWCHACARAGVGRGR